MSNSACDECGTTDFSGYIGEPDECVLYGWCCNCGQLKVLKAHPVYYEHVAHFWPKFSDIMLAYALGSGASGL